MKLKTIAYSFILLFATSTFAQEQGKPGKTGKDKTPRQFPSEQMISELNLSDKQVAQFRTLQEENAKKRQDMRQSKKEAQKAVAPGGKPTPEQREANADARRKEQTAMRASYREEIKNILDKKQYLKYLEFCHDNSGRNQQGPRNDKNKGRGDNNKGRGRK